MPVPVEGKGGRCLTVHALRCIYSNNDPANDVDPSGCHSRTDSSGYRFALWARCIGVNWVFVCCEPRNWQALGSDGDVAIGCALEAGVDSRDRPGIWPRRGRRHSSLTSLVTHLTSWTTSARTHEKTCALLHRRRRGDACGGRCVGEPRCVARRCSRSCHRLRLSCYGCMEEPRSAIEGSGPLSRTRRDLALADPAFGEREPTSWCCRTFKISASLHANEK